MAERLGFVVLASDVLRKTLFPSPGYSSEESSRLFRACHHLIEGLLKGGIPLILDATNLSERHREYIYSITDHVDSKLILVWVEAPTEVVQQRLKVRAEKANADEHSDADWTVYQRMKSSVEKIRRKHYVVDTSKDVTPVLDKIVREVSR